MDGEDMMKDEGMMDDTSSAAGAFPAGAVEALGIVSAFAALTF